MRGFAWRYWNDETGASAAEFALVLIPFVTLVLGIIGTCVMLYANQTLQEATEAAARCAAMIASTCTNNTATQAYALNRYKGPGVSPTFVATRGGCGHTVTGSASFPLNAGIINISVPLSASACFPGN